MFGRKEKNRTRLSFNDWNFCLNLFQFRSSRPEVFLGKGVLKIYSKFTGEHTCRNVISIKLPGNFFEIALRHGCSPLNLLHIFRTLFLKTTSGGLLLSVATFAFAPALWFELYDWRSDCCVSSTWLVFHKF